jgi:hypothetical protein
MQICYEGYVKTCGMGAEEERREGGIKGRREGGRDKRKEGGREDLRGPYAGRGFPSPQEGAGRLGRHPKTLGGREGGRKEGWEEGREG